jgi:hypothetical protein
VWSWGEGQVAMGIGEDARRLVGHGWEEEVGQEERAPLDGGPRNQELCHPWRVAAGKG